MSIYHIPGIKRIDIVSCEHLSAGAMLQSICGMTVAIAAPHRQIKIIGKADLKWKSSKEHGKSQESSELQFRSAEVIDSEQRLAFVVTTAAGHQYLIGAREGRYPKVEWEESSGDTSKAAAIKSYKISHVAQKSVLPCVL